MRPSPGASQGQAQGSCKLAIRICGEVLYCPYVVWGLGLARTSSANFRVGKPTGAIRGPGGGGGARGHAVTS
eukprot:11178199-Lingulodinium_polyedra.AAC.1